MIAVIDLGSQTAHLIARRVRELSVRSEIFSHRMKAAEFDSLPNLAGIILSGGPADVFAQGAPRIDPKIYDLGVPILGICYGMHLMGHDLGGKVITGREKEFGGVEVVLKKSVLFAGLQPKQQVWMNHGNQVVKLPAGFTLTGTSRNTPMAAMENAKRHLYSTIFHPEVVHTKNGMRILENFVLAICKATKDWDKSKVLLEQIEKVKAQVGREKIICALSGGVDSATAAALVYKAVGDQLACVFVDTGLMRLGETDQVGRDFKKFFGRSLVIVKAEEQFLKALKDQEDPETKRKIIGELFIRIFESESRKLGKVKFLVQGTIYPDVIESAKKHDTADVIKSHHNVGGLPEKMDFELVEPLRDLYKDEVRQVAKKLGLPDSIVWRQPFPGPGLAVRVRGVVTRERLERLRQADAILQEEADKFKLPEGIWVTQAIYVPLKTTGVKGDGRSFDEMIAIRSLTSVDAMTADWTRLPYELLAIVSSRIVNEVPGINRVVYDITTKPPATMEWE